MKRSFKFGQSLIEVVIAMAIVIAASVALVSTTIFTQKTSRSANSQVLATKLAEESIEKMRVFRDRKGFGEIPNSTNCSILDSSSSDIMLWNMNTGCSGNGDPIVLDQVTFYRKIEVCINNSAPCNGSVDKKHVTVTVSWNESGGLRSVSTHTYFSRF